MSDIHGDLETFDVALEYVLASDAEVLAITGDLSGKVFSHEEEKPFVETTQKLQSIAQQFIATTKGNVRTFHDAAEFLVSARVEAPVEIKQCARDYLNFENIARERMLQTYTGFKTRFDDLGKKVLLVPGNWDGKCIDDVLAHENIHSKYFEEVEGVRFIGYGGAYEPPKVLPPYLTVKFDRDDAYSHLIKYEAEIALMHTMPRGFGDNATHPGEYSLLAYMYRNQPDLILVGHTHTPFIIKDEKSGVMVVNPGNLGKYNDESFGTFLEIETDEYSVRPKALHQVMGSSIITEELSENVPAR